MAERRLLLVGGSGYFGSRLAEALASDWNVTVTIRSPSPVRSAWLAGQGLARISYDSAKQADLPISGDFDAIINLAMPGAGAAGRDPDAAVELGKRTAAACLALLRTGQAKRLVHFSTFHIYGPNAGPSYLEDTPPAPRHPYGQAHLAVEQLLLGNDLADRILILRPTNMVGAPAHADLGDQAGLIFLDLCKQAATMEKLVLRNDGDSYRDILPFSDAIAAVERLLGASDIRDRVFNLGAGQAITMRTLAETIASAADSRVAIDYGTGSDDFRTPFAVDISRIQSLGWRPSASLRDEASRTIGFFA